MVWAILRVPWGTVEREGSCSRGCGTGHGSLTGAWLCPREQPSKDWPLCLGEMDGISDFGVFQYCICQDPGENGHACVDTDGQKKTIGGVESRMSSLGSIYGKYGAGSTFILELGP